MIGQLSKARIARVIRKPAFWLILALLVLIAFPHYQETLKHPAFLTDAMLNLGLTRHAFERILYLAPIVWASFLFGWKGAFITSVGALTLMLPRAIFISPYPKDSLFETWAVFIIGNVLAVGFDALGKERQRRVHLAALDRTSSVVSQSLELSQILKGSLDTVLNVMKADGALVFLVDEETKELVLTAHQGIYTDFAQGIDRLKLGGGFNGRVAGSGEPLLVKDAAQAPGLTSELGSQHEIRSALIVPLSSKGKVNGTLCVATHSRREFRPDEVELLTAVGNQIGVAVENARLYQQLRESEEKYRVIFETTGTATIIIEPDTTISLANGGFEKLSGYSRTEVEGRKKWIEFVVEADLEKMRGLSRFRMLEPRFVPENYEFRFLDRWGAIRDIFLTVAMIPGTQKSVASLLDITDLKRAEEQIRASLKEKEASERRYRELFENAHDAIWVQDMSGNITTANEAAARLIGYDVEVLTQMNVRRFLSEEGLELAREVGRKLLLEEAIGGSYDQRLIRADGSEALIRISSSLIRADGKPVAFQHIARDITEEKLMQENLRFYLQQATRAQEEERKRISRELHDETIQSLVVLSRRLDLASNSKGLSEETRQRLEELREHTNDIMKGLRRLSQDLRPAALDRLGLLSALEWLAADVTEYSGVATKVRVAGDQRRLPEEVELVLFRITQEALRNVWRHAQATQAEVLVEFDGRKVRITVTDNGKGFNLPERMGDLAKEGKLGLAGIQERAQLIRGTLTVQSEPGKGSSITIEVPV